MKPTFEQLIGALRKSWSRETAFDASEWSEENPARGQCVVSSLVAQDYLGGELQRYEVTGEGVGESHYANLLDGGVILDTTASQYGGKTVQFTPSSSSLKGYTSVREKCLAGGNTRERYELLKRRVEALLH